MGHLLMLPLTPFAPMGAVIRGGPFTPQGPFDGAALSQLSALVKYLGGDFIMPGQNTYIAQDSAWPQTALPADGTIGYVGDVGTQGMAENFVANSEMVGAGVGVLPTGWAGALTANGVTAAVSGKGTDADGTYTELSFSGTAGGSPTGFYVYLNGFATSPQQPASAGSLYTASCKLKAVSGTQRDIRLILRELVGTSESTAHGVSSLLVGTQQRNTTARLVGTGTTKVYSVLYLAVPAGSGTWDQVIRIYQPQLNRGNPIAYTPTYGTAVSRPQFAAAAQSTTAACPILRDISGKKWAQFDGNDDHLATGIPTPSTGYVCVVGRQDEALGSVNALIGGYTTTQAGCSLDISAAGYPRLTRAKSDGTTDVCASTGAISVGVPFVVDASWAASSAKVRLNGTAEGTSGVTKDPVGTQIMTIGARNTHATVGSVTPAELFGGNEGAVIVIPNVTLPTATEQRIRQLAAQIYGIPGVL